MTEEVPEFVEKQTEQDGIEDVTEEFMDELETIIDIAHTRRHPVPIEHAAAFSTSDSDGALLVFAINTSDTVENIQGFEVAYAEDMEMDEVTEDANQQLEAASNQIWREAVNIT